MILPGTEVRSPPSDTPVLPVRIRVLPRFSQCCPSTPRAAPWLPAVLLVPHQCSQRGSLAPLGAPSAAPLPLTGSLQYSHCRPSVTSAAIVLPNPPQCSQYGLYCHPSSFTVAPWLTPSAPSDATVLLQCGCHGPSASPSSPKFSQYISQCHTSAPSALWADYWLPSVLRISPQYFLYSSQCSDSAPSVSPVLPVWLPAVPAMLIEQAQCCGTRGHPERVWISQSFVFQQTAHEDGEISVRVGRCSSDSKVGKHSGCPQPSRKQVQAYDTIGQPVVEMVKGADKVESSQQS